MSSLENELEQHELEQLCVVAVAAKSEKKLNLGS